MTKQISVENQTFKVKIPRGVEDGARIRLRGKGEPSYRGGSAGDLYVTVFVGKHPLYERASADLKITVPITWSRRPSVRWCDVPTLDGKVRLRIPAGTPSGKMFKVTGRGIERPSGTKGRSHRDRPKCRSQPSCRRSRPPSWKIQGKTDRPTTLELTWGCKP